MIDYEVKLKCPCGETQIMRCHANNHSEAERNARLFAEELDNTFNAECDWNPERALDVIHVYNAVRIEPKGLVY